MLMLCDTRTYSKEKISGEFGGFFNCLFVTCETRPQFAIGSVWADW